MPHEVAKCSVSGTFKDVELTIAEAAERIGVSPRRARALVERGQLPAVRRGRMWFTTPEAADAFRRNSPGRGRPLSQRTAWTKITQLAEEGSFAELRSVRVALRARAAHRRYRIDPRLASRLGEPKGTFRSGLAALAGHGAPVTAGGGAAIDLYATPDAAERLLERTGAQQDPAGNLNMHVMAGRSLPHLSARARLVVAWCDLADRIDPAADLAAERLWPGSVPVQHLATVAETGVDFTTLRAFVDWATRHPNLQQHAVESRPRRTGDPRLDSLVAAVAETLADDAGFARPEWAGTVPPAPGDTPFAPDAALEAPAAFAARGIRLPRETFWRQR